MNIPENILNTLTDEQKKRIEEVKSPEELLTIAKETGYESRSVPHPTNMHGLLKQSGISYFCFGNSVLHPSHRRPGNAGFGEMPAGKRPGKIRIMVHE